MLQSSDGTAATPAASSFASNAAPAAGGVAPAYAAGLGTFRFGDITATVFNCLRSGTRVFCDFDETKQQSGQVPAGFAYNAVKLILGSGRVMASHAAHYVDQDGSTFDTAELSPNVPVRMVVEYDDVPASYTSADLAFGSDRIQAVPVTDMPATQAAGTIASRPVPAAAPAGATDPSTALNNTTDKVSQGIDKVNNAKSSLKSLWKKAGTLNQ